MKRDASILGVAGLGLPLYQADPIYIKLPFGPSLLKIAWCYGQRTWIIAHATEDTKII